MRLLKRRVQEIVQKDMGLTKQERYKVDSTITDMVMEARYSMEATDEEGVYRCELAREVLYIALRASHTKRIAVDKYLTEQGFELTTAKRSNLVGEEVEIGVIVFNSKKLNKVVDK